MPIFYKKQSNGTVDQVDLPASEQARALASGWSLSIPSVDTVDVVTGNVKPYSPATPNAVEDTYLDEMLKQVEQESTAQRGYAQQGYNTFVQQLKESRDLWNKDLEKTYGRTLEKANVNVYERGVQDSGIKGKQTTEIGQDKAYQAEQRDLLETQKQQIVSQDLKQRMESIGRQEERSRASFKSPYAEYSYT